jgi:AraC-like DNA-binding protein
MTMSLQSQHIRRWPHPDRKSRRETLMLAAIQVESLRRPRAEPMALPRIMPAAAALADVVEAFMDWEVSDLALANSITMRILPSSSPLLCVHYRSTVWSNRCGVGCCYRHIAWGIQTEAAAVRSCGGPIGAVVVRLKPEAASRVIGVSLRELTNAAVQMRDLFGAGPVSLLEEQLAEAENSLERVHRVEEFLEPRLRAQDLSAAMRFAAQALRADPTLSTRLLAAHLDISERHLSRSFRAIFGTSPKQFARIARISRILQARWYGGAWTDIAHSLGFFDQAHMINDFKSLVGLSPSQFFYDASSRNAVLNCLLGRSPFSNLLVTCDFNVRAPQKDRSLSS